MYIYFFYLFEEHARPLLGSLANAVLKPRFSFDSAGVEGAFKKLKPDPCASSPHIGHTPTTASCPTPARRRHRTTFTQVCTRQVYLFFFSRLRQRRKYIRVRIAPKSFLQRGFLQ